VSLEIGEMNGRTPGEKSKKKKSKSPWRKPLTKKTAGGSGKKMARKLMRRSRGEIKNQTTTRRTVAEKIKIKTVVQHHNRLRTSVCRYWGFLVWSLQKLHRVRQNRSQ
jgi:hypothetical protein